MAFAFASPNRVLDSIKRLELQEAELPSLPSIQPNFDYDSGMDTSRSSADPEEYKAYEQPSEDVSFCLAGYWLRMLGRVADHIGHCNSPSE